MAEVLALWAGEDAGGKGEVAQGPTLAVGTQDRGQRSALSTILA